MIDFKNEEGIVDKPNVKLLYEIIHDTLREVSVPVMDFVALLEMMKIESIAGTYEPNEEDDEEE